MKTLHDTILADFSASYWLKAAIRALDKRDPIDAMNDTLTLLEVCKERLESLTP
jgi:hypothetical protein